MLIAASFVVASIHMWRRPPQDDEAPVAEIVAADGATVTDSAVAAVALAAVVIQVTAAIHANGELTANFNRVVGGTGAGVGGTRAHGTAHFNGPASATDATHITFS